MSEVAKKLSFEDAILERIRNSIGELMTQEDLKRIIDAGVQKALFEPRITIGSYGNQSSSPSLVDRAVTDFLSTQMKTAVDKWISENPEALQAAVDKAVKDGVANCVMQSLDQRFSWIFSNLVSPFQSNGVIPRTH